jgi:hypothetical protein
LFDFRDSLQRKVRTARLDDVIINHTEALAKSSLGRAYFVDEDAA